MNNVVLHIGYHKSASTFLQKDIFPQLPVNYVFLSGPQRQMLDMVESDIEFDANILQKWVNREIDHSHQANRERVTVISQEELSGHPHGYKIVNPITTAQNLKKAFPNAKILIIIRNQLDYLTSLYSYRVAVKGEEYRSFTQFLSEEEKKGIIDHLEYHKLINYYIDLFGRTRVLVLPMEYLIASRDTFFHKLTDFIDVPYVISSEYQPENVSTKLLFALSLWRPVNYVFHLLLSAMLSLSGKDSLAYEPEVYKGYYPFIKLRYAYYAFKRRSTKLLNRLFSRSKRINIQTYPEYCRLVDRFEKSNACLEEITELDLKSLNYPVRKQ
jgi:hypothetical protein